MPDTAELKRLLSLVKKAKYNTVEGLDVFRDLLEVDTDGHVRRFLMREMRKLEGERLGGIAFVIAEHCLKVGDVKRLRLLFATDDANVKESGLNGLWGDPASNPRMGPAIVRLAVDAANDSSPAVRTQVSSVLQNQCAWGVDVSPGIAPLCALLKDRNDRVRHQAAYAVGNFAKKRHDMSRCIPLLRRNLKHKDVYVRESSAWALWQLSRHKHDIGSSVPELVWLLTDAEDYNEPRKKAAGALTHHAKKAPENEKDVKDHVRRVTLDERHKEIKTFVDQLANMD